jgi:hypothetical protein
MVSQALSIRKNEFKRRGDNFESGAKVTDVRCIQKRKHPSQMTSTDAGMAIEAK